MYFQHWEKPRPPAAPRRDSRDQERLDGRADTLGQMIDAAFQVLATQRCWEEERIAELLAAVADVAVYRKAHARASIRASNVDGLRNARTSPMWSSGSTGHTQPIAFNRELVVTDALQGARQLSLQSSEAV